MSKKLVYFLLLTMFYFSCADKESEHDKEAPAKDIPNQEIDSVKDSIEEIIIHPDSSFQIKALILKKKLLLTSANKSDVPSILPDRFESEWNLSFSLVKEDSTGDITSAYYFYEYSDSSSLGNVLSNWYSCFGKSCEMITPGKKTKIQTSQTSYTLTGRNYIVHFTSSCPVNKLSYSEICDELKVLFGKKLFNEIITDCDGRLSWK